MSVTIKDIAKIANVSHTTVSRALNDSPLISEATKNKIKKIARELSYTPNYNAKSLVLDRSYNIGVFFSTMGEGTSPDFFYEVISGVSHVIKNTYNLVVAGIDDYDDYTLINKKRYDGIIVMSQSNKDNGFIYNIIEKKIPIVVLNRKMEEQGIINILSNDRKGAYNAVEFLINQGHKRIAIIEGKKGFESTRERKEGYIEALIGNGIDVKKKYMVQGKYDLGSGYQAMLNLLDISERPTAVFCSNDDMAIGAMKAITEKGLRVKDDISVVGFDGSKFSAYCLPALTTVKRPIQKISSDGVRKLLALIDNKEVSEGVYYMNTELIIRDSVGKIE
ncbi:LacI family DNA-binding transcriptional regulator [Paramaledivibacter caminithermalis]|jgi:LacI family transcriptional regulator|uniref:Transcriptional regulator, LacI family n=1 Tax=Paramaledivibacter caminithermalis (strain DSM 15212 / CIP 107654 / DViRD3) TaxID=1121301 RepID=A0A1M6NTC8_PARC5|nr:LacI family DNA-binding transcriptional regulator [Paramaledivibacter caminithermalis]SHJ98895.1 transcriptional regulator, LacI family [Paramaledivibacter caminithermalis DSM 15212]